MANRLTTYDPELETFEGEEELAGSREFDVLGELDEMSFAAKLLELRDEQELDRLLGHLAVRVGRRIGITGRSSVGTAVVAVLKAAVKQAVPTVNAFGGPIAGPYGATMGSRIATVASSKLGIELEGLSHEDKDFETARRLVRFASEAMKNALSAAGMSPGVAARAGVFAAARRYAPGLLRAFGPTGAAAGAGRGGGVSNGSEPLALRASSRGFTAGASVRLGLGTSRHSGTQAPAQEAE